MLCPNCGQTPPESSRFCHMCGQRLPIQEASPGASAGPDSPPQWYQQLERPPKGPRLWRPTGGLRRIGFGIAGNQPQKWLAELAPGQKVRIAFAEGKVRPRAPRPWERTDSVPVRHPWTTEKEGALLLIVENRAYRYADIRDQWITVPDRSQVYIGIQDTRHGDNQGDYSGVLEIAERDAG